MVEMFILHTIPKYDPVSNSVRTFDGTYVSYDRMIAGGGTHEFASDTFEIIRAIHELKLTPEALGILCCLVLFSPDREYSASLDSG